MKIKPTISRIAFSALRILGYSFQIHNLRGLVDYLNRNHIELGSLLDIGAYKGEFSSYLRSISRIREFVLIEPNSSHNWDIARSGFTVFNVLLSNDNGERKFYSTNSTGDSYYPVLNSDGNVSNFRVQSTTTLDEFYIDHPELSLPDFIKIDTQGSELDVLRGGKSVVSNAKLVVLELPIVQYNLGSPSLDETVRYMIQANFIPIYLTEVHIVREVLVQIDIAFLNKKIFEKLFGPLVDRGFWHTISKDIKLKNRDFTSSNQNE